MTNAFTVDDPCLLIFVVFTAFYFTYPKDAARVRTLLAARRVDLLANSALQDKPTIDLDDRPKFSPSSTPTS